MEEEEEEDQNNYSSTYENGMMTKKGKGCYYIHYIICTIT